MKRKRRVWIFGIIALVVIAAGVALAMVLGGSDNTSTAAKNGQATFTVKRGDIKQTLVTYGKVTPKQEYTFTFDGDRVNEILVDVGQRVENNKVLASLDETQLELSLLQAERAFKEAQAEGIPAIVREKELAYEIASSNYEDATLRAPFAGVVTTIDQATASTENWRIVLIDTSELYVEANLDQLDAPNVAEGQSAQATIEPLPDKMWPVEIVDVGGMAVTQGNSTTVSVTGKLPEADPSILVGYTVEMEILTADAEDVLRVPISSLIESPRGWMVMKLVEGEPTPQQVKIGVTSDDYAEITEGLEEGDIILVSAATLPESTGTEQGEGGGSGTGQGGGSGTGEFPKMP